MICLCRYIAKADHRPENLYHYAQENGTRDVVTLYSDIMEALEDLPAYESTCEKSGSVYRVVCYALEEGS